ncbi:ABC-2 family transporter protein [Paenibacillus sp. 32O-W]|uniref:ABC transporter permease n=1 Tax=Paenibacillus sp. 32O-W TaxID=1695218 RepID=UPI0011A53B9E|nr:MULTISPECIES: ABC-2 family transporter protein [Paenibacillaceae]
MSIFWSFTRQSFHNTAIYRFEYWLQLVSAFLMMYSVYWIWNILYSEHPGAFGVSLNQMATYGVLGMALEAIFNPGQGPQMYISSQIKSGSIDTDLIKPLDFHLHMLARNFGEISFRFGTIVLPAALVGVLFLDLKPPVSALNALLFVVSLLLGYLVLFSLNFLLGMVSVLTIDIRSITWTYNSLLRFFAGQMVPLWLFPGWLNGLANALPFKCIFSIPLSIYIGKQTGAGVWESLLFQAVWVAGLLVICRLTWSAVHSKLAVQGG